jgi:uncharacterized protein with beta-barrel porin domain
VAGDPGLSVRLQSHFATLATTSNQQSVAAALDAGGNRGGYGAGGANLLTTLIQNNTAATAPAAFDRLSGEGLAGQQQAVLNATELFASTVLDAARGGLASDNVADSGRGRVWLTGFGQGAHLDSARSTGSAPWSDSLAGFAIGADFRLDSGLTLGVASGYSNARYSEDARNTRGESDAGHMALYGFQSLGAYYATAVFDAAFNHNTTNRLAQVTSENSSFSGTEVLGRIEGGRVFAFAPGNVTPLAGFQAAGLFNDAFSESGGDAAGLHVNRRTVDSEKLYIGAQIDATQVFGNGMRVVPFARIAWEHEFDTDRMIRASFSALPGSGFTVAGTPAVSDAARITAGAKLDLTNAVAIYGSFDGAFSGNGNLYGGKGGVRVTF